MGGLLNYNRINSAIPGLNRQITPGECKISLDHNQRRFVWSTRCTDKFHGVGT